MADFLRAFAAPSGVAKHLEMMVTNARVKTGGAVSVISSLGRGSFTGSETRATGPKPSGSQPQRALIGRDAELRSLRAALARAGQGVSQTVVLVGPSGVGKTTVLNRFVELAQSEGATVFSALGEEDELDVSFGVVEQLFPTLDAGSRDEIAVANVGTKVVAACRSLPSTIVLV